MEKTQESSVFAIREPLKRVRQADSLGKQRPILRVGSKPRGNYCVASVSWLECGRYKDPVVRALGF